MTRPGSADATAKKEDELLVVRCQLGERAAFEELIERWHPPLWGYLRRVAGNDDAARDVIQDVWVACWLARLTRRRDALERELGRKSGSQPGRA